MDEVLEALARCKGTRRWALVPAKASPRPPPQAAPSSGSSSLPAAAAAAVRPARGVPRSRSHRRGARRPPGSPSDSEPTNVAQRRDAVDPEAGSAAGSQRLAARHAAKDAPGPTTSGGAKRKAAAPAGGGSARTPAKKGRRGGAAVNEEPASAAAACVNEAGAGAQAASARVVSNDEDPPLVVHIKARFRGFGPDQVAAFRAHLQEELGGAAQIVLRDLPKARLESLARFVDELSADGLARRSRSRSEAADENTAKRRAREKPSRKEPARAAKDVNPGREEGLEACNAQQEGRRGRCLNDAAECVSVGTAPQEVASAAPAPEHVAIWQRLNPLLDRLTAAQTDSILRLFKGDGQCEAEGDTITLDPWSMPPDRLRAFAAEVERLAAGKTHGGEEEQRGALAEEDEDREQEGEEDQEEEVTLAKEKGVCCGMDFEQPIIPERGDSMLEFAHDILKLFPEDLFADENV